MYELYSSTSSELRNVRGMMFYVARGRMAAAAAGRIDCANLPSQNIPTQQPQRVVSLSPYQSSAEPLSLSLSLSLSVAAGKAKIVKKTRRGDDEAEC